MGSNFFFSLAAITTIAFLMIPVNSSHAFAFIFAGEVNGVGIVAHQAGYTGVGGTVTVTVGIDPASPNAILMVPCVQNVVNTFNSIVPTTGNVILGGANNIGASEIDFESVLLHEMGHSLGLAHPNCATESGLIGADRNYTKSTDGADNAFTLGIGTDAVRGSNDDTRGDDVNLHYFRISNNNPFTIDAVVDASTYSRNLVSLPSGTYAANADRDVGTLLGTVSTECVMQQETFFDEAQRTLGHDDVAGLRYAMSGLDEIAGTADDYILQLSYVGLTTSANIVVSFDNAQTVFAVSSSGGTFLSATHIAITNNNIYFNTGFNWFYNSTTLPVEWVNFATEIQGDDVKLHWATSAEVNLDYFEIERSSDNSHWNKVGELAPLHATPFGQNYQFVDEDVKQLGSQFYYRIKQIDGDGASTYSDIKEARFTLQESAFITMGPIPVSASTFVQFFLTLPEQVHFVIRDLSGKEVDAWVQAGVAGPNQWSIGEHLMSLSRGVYILTMDGISVHEEVKFTR